mgnify:FL=1
MSETKKFVVKEGKEARQAVEKGVDAAANILRLTLGPRGVNVLLDQGPNRTPRILNDGVTIAEFLWNRYDLTPFEAKVAQAFIDGSKKTKDKVGDGTTGTAVIAQKIVHEAFARMPLSPLGSFISTSAMDIRREIREAWPKAVEELKKSAKPVKTLGDLKKVAFAAIERKDLAEVVADMVWKIGADGHITVEDSLGYELETEIVEGIFIPACTATPMLAELNDRKEAVWEDTWVIVTNHDIKNLTQLDAPAQTIFKHLAEKGVSNENIRLAIFAPRFERHILDAVLQLNRTVFRLNDGRSVNTKILPVKIPALTEDWMEDVASAVDAKMINKHLGFELEKMVITDFGKAKKVTSFWDYALILGGSGNTKPRLEKLKERLKHETVLIARKRLERRIASLAAAVGIIRTGAATDLERIDMREKLIDGTEAAKAALEEGVVKGGGKALYDVAKKFKGSVLKAALEAPYEQIQANAGGSLEIGADILDPLKVIRISLENACSVAAQLITIGALVVEDREPDVRTVADAIKSKPVMENAAGEASQWDIPEERAE